MKKNFILFCLIVFYPLTVFSQTYEELCRKYNELGETSYPQKIELLTQIIENFPDIHLDITYNNRGIVYQNMKEYAKSIEDFGIAINLKPDNHQAYFNRGTSYGFLLDHSKAIEDISEAIRIDPAASSIYYTGRAFSYVVLKDYNAAIKDLDISISMNNKDAEAFQLRGAAYMYLKDNLRAIDDYNNAIKLVPRFEEAYACLGIAYFNLQDYEKALDIFEKSKTLISSNKRYRSLLSLAIVHYALNNIEKAKLYVKEAMNSDPRLSEGKSGLSKFDWLEGSFFYEQKGTIETLLELVEK